MLQFISLYHYFYCQNNDSHSTGLECAIWTQHRRFSMPMNIPKDCSLRIWGHKNLLPHHKLNRWRFLSNCFPTRDRLSSIFSIENTNCPICLCTYCFLFLFLVLVTGFSLQYYKWRPWLQLPLDCLRLLWSVTIRVLNSLINHFSMV